jgi:hypothetical protein
MSKIDIAPEGRLLLDEELDAVNGGFFGAITVALRTLIEKQKEMVDDDQSQVQF